MAFASWCGPAVAGQAVTVQSNPAHTGASVEPGLEPPLQMRWHRRFRRPPSYPLIAGGRVFVTVPAGRQWENGPARIEALSGRTGKTLWSRELGGDFQTATAAYDGGRVFALNDGLVLRAFAAGNGRLLWERDYGDGVSDGPPVAKGGVVYVVLGSQLHAIDGSDGGVIWRAVIDGTADCAPALAGDRIYAAFVGPQVYAFARASGAELWHPETSLHGGGCDTPALYRGRLYVRDWASLPHGYIYGAGSGALLGRFAADADPAFARGLGLFLDARVHNEPIPLGGTLRARELRSGRIRWRFRGDGYLQSAPLIVNRTAYVGSGSGRLYGLDLRTGRVRWRAHVTQGISAPNWGGGAAKTLAAGDGLLVAPAARDLFAFE
jgi:outer membrane protein assembly factor BamB